MLFQVACILPEANPLNTQTLSITNKQNLSQDIYIDGKKIRWDYSSSKVAKSKIAANFDQKFVHDAKSTDMLLFLVLRTNCFELLYVPL